MNEQSQAKSPEALRAMVAGTLANFQHPTLKHNLTTLKALHHVAWMDDTLHVENWLCHSSGIARLKS